MSRCLLARIRLQRSISAGAQGAAHHGCDSVAAMQSTAATVDAYVAEAPAERRGCARALCDGSAVRS